MTQLGRCKACGGFAAKTHAVCMHCGSSRTLLERIPLPVRVLGGALGGGAIAFTLMACYGGPPMPPCPDGNRDCQGPIKEDAGPSTPMATPDPGK